MDRMRAYWYNPNSVGYLTTPRVFHRFLKGKGHEYTVKQVETFVNAQPAYQKTKETKISKEFVPFITTAPNIFQQCDLAFFNTKNSRNKHVALVCVDVFSSKIYAKLMQQRKTAAATWRAYESLLQTMPSPPYYLATDQGSEFLGKYFASRAKERGIKTKLMKTYQHASVAERAIGKIRQKWRRIRANTDTHDLRKSLPKIVSQLNSTPHSVFGIAPNDVSHANAGTVFQRRYGNYFEKLAKHRNVPIKEGDQVRIRTIKSASSKNAFGNKNIPNFSSELYTVYDIRSTYPTTYVLEDSQNKVLSRFYYPHEIVRT